MAAGLLVFAFSVAASLFPSGVDSAQCADTQTIEVASTADAWHLSDALNCTGGGVFDVTWYGSVSINETIQVSDGISLTVSGSGFSSKPPLDGDAPTATIVGVKSTSETGIFHVSGASSLTLDNLVIKGGRSNHTTGAGAVRAKGSAGVIPTVSVIDCHFMDNYGRYAGVRL